MKDRIKITMQMFFYIMAIIGILDMFCQTFTEGRIKPIKTVICSMKHGIRHLYVCNKECKNPNKL